MTSRDESPFIWMNDENGVFQDCGMRLAYNGAFTAPPWVMWTETVIWICL